MLRVFVRGYRRAVAQLVPPSACPICLEPVPVLGIKDVTQEDDEAFAKLRCKHKFCAGRWSVHIQARWRVGMTD